MIVPPKEWLPRLAALAKRWGALLILDECQLAPARTGKMWAMEHYGVTPDIVTWGKGLSAGLAICGTITTPADRRADARQRRPAMGRHLFERPARLGRRLEAARHRAARQARPDAPSGSGAIAGDGARQLKNKYDCIGDVRGKGLYRMLDIVKDQKSKIPDPVMAERIRYNCALEGIIGISVKHYFRFAPPLIVTEAEIKDIVGRLDIAIKRAMDGFPKEVDVRESSSLSIGDRPIAAE